MKTGKLYYKLQCLVILAISIYFINKVQAQKNYKDTLYLKEENSEHLSKYYTYFSANIDAPADEIDNIYGRGLFKRWKWKKTFNSSDIDHYVWFRVAIKNTLTNKENFVWTFYNHVDSIYLYKIVEGQMRPLAMISGDMPPSKRPFAIRNLSIPFTLAAGEATVLYAKVIEHASHFYLPTDISTVADYLAFETKYLVVSNWYILVGFFLFTVLFNLILFLYLKDYFHLWYAGYVLSSLVFLLMEDGLDALVFPDSLYFLCRHIAHFTFLLLATACGIGVMQMFIKQAKESRIYKICKAIIIFDICFAILFALSYDLLRSRSEYNICSILNTVRDIALLISITVIAISLVHAILKGNKLALYYTITFIFFLVGSIIFYLNYHGLANIHFVEPNQLAVGISIELVLLLFLITVRYQHIIKENSQIKIRELEQQKSIASQIILAQDIERQRLARDLHDDLGNTVTQIHLLLTKIQNNETYSQSVLGEMKSLIKKVSSDVRSISHELMPANLKEKGLFEAVTDVVDIFSQHSTVAFRFYSKGVEDDIPYDLKLVIYRIFTELSNNIIKHAKATHAELQCILYDTYILLSSEDNGKGINTDGKSDGIGLKNIKNRIEHLKGKITVDSSEVGTTIIIEIPL